MIKNNRKNPRRKGRRRRKKNEYSLWMITRLTCLFLILL